MTVNELNLNSVNFEHGMLLTPDHFIRQERYTEALVRWALRFTTGVYGLIGGGPRVAESERGAARFDPVVTLSEDEQALTITVAQCRGVTPAGSIVEVTPDAPLEQRFSKAEMEGVREAPVYVCLEEGAKEAFAGDADEFNPQMLTGRRYRYRLALAPPGQEGSAAACARIRRQRYGAGWEKDPDYIPACAHMTAHTELAAAYRRIVELGTFLADRYAELHRAMREYIVLFTERGIETEVDMDTVMFVERMAIALHECAYDLLDSAQPPQNFFGRLRRLFHSTALLFDLTPGMQSYYETLRQAGETAFIQLLEQQKQILKTTRSVALRDDLGVEARAALSNLSALLRLEQALEGKYLDFRVSNIIEAMNFIFDRGGNVLYKLAAKPARVQGMAAETLTYFSQLRLEGRDKYRLVLVGEAGAAFEAGTRINAEVRINEGSGFQRAPLNLVCEARVPGQVNFEMDFEAPDVPAITDIKVAVASHLPIRTALLFSRHRFFAGRAKEPAAPRAEPIARLAEPPAPAPRVESAPRAPEIPAQPVRPEPGAAAARRAPWSAAEDTPAPPPRRRRLE